MSDSKETTVSGERQVTLKEVEKLESELERVSSENRDLKELIIKILFDKYGY